MKNILRAFDELVNSRIDELTRDELYFLFRTNLYAMRYAPYTVKILSHILARRYPVPFFDYDSILNEIMRVDDLEMYKFVETRRTCSFLFCYIDPCKHPRIFEYVRPKLLKIIEIEMRGYPELTFASLCAMPDFALEIDCINPHTVQIFIQSGQYEVAEKLMRKFNFTLEEVVRIRWCVCCEYTTGFLDWIYAKSPEIIGGGQLRDFFSNVLSKSRNDLAIIKWFTSRFNVCQLFDGNASLDEPIENFDVIAHLNECGLRLELKNVHPNAWAKYADHFSIIIAPSDLDRVLYARLLPDGISKSTFEYLRDVCGVKFKDIAHKGMHKGLRVFADENFLNAIAVYKPISDTFLTRAIADLGGLLYAYIYAYDCVFELCDIYADVFAEFFTPEQLHELETIYARVSP